MKAFATLNDVSICNHRISSYLVQWPFFIFYSSKSERLEEKFNANSISIDEHKSLYRIVQFRLISLSIWVVNRYGTRFLQFVHKFISCSRAEALKVNIMTIHLYNSGICQSWWRRDRKKRSGKKVILNRILEHQCKAMRRKKIKIFILHLYVQL